MSEEETPRIVNDLSTSDGQVSVVPDNVPVVPLQPTVSKRSQNKSIQQLIRMVLDSPISSDKKYEVDGKLDISSFKKKNTDVQTRIILQVATEAMKGDRQSAEFLMKYGGFEPTKESHITVDTPVFIDDIGKKENVAIQQDIPIYDDPEESEDKS